MLVKNKNKLRLRANYGALNKLTHPDCSSLPPTGDLHDPVRHTKYLASLDPLSVYCQINLKDGDWRKTMFQKSSVLYLFPRMHFALTTASSTFQRAVTLVLGSLICGACVVYLDDIVVVASTRPERLTEVERRFELVGISFCALLWF